MKFCYKLHIVNKLLLLSFRFVPIPENRFLNLRKFCKLDIFYKTSKSSLLNTNKFGRQLVLVEMVLSSNFSYDQLP